MYLGPSNRCTLWLGRRVSFAKRLRNTFDTLPTEISLGLFIACYSVALAKDGWGGGIRPVIRQGATSDDVANLS